MIGNKVLIAPDSAEKTTKSGIILSQAEAEIPTKGIVVSVGNKVKELKESDYVIYEPRHAMRIEHDNIFFLIFGPAFFSADQYFGFLLFSFLFFVILFHVFN